MTWHHSSKRRLAMGVLAAGGLAAAWAALSIQATTKQGVDFRVTTYAIPLHLKIREFLARHRRYGALARQITRDLRTEEERVLAVLAWTRQHVRRQPGGRPVIDDHILSIIERGYGLSDQIADVFATLSTYAGVPAFWGHVRAQESTEAMVVAFAEVDGRWTPIDPAEGLIFRNAEGRLATVEELQADPTLIDRVAGDIHPHDLPYRAYLQGLGPVTRPTVLRAELQMPWPRVKTEVTQAIFGTHRAASSPSGGPS